MRAGATSFPESGRRATVVPAQRAEQIVPVAAPRPAGDATAFAGAPRLPGRDIPLGICDRSAIGVFWHHRQLALASGGRIVRRAQPDRATHASRGWLMVSWVLGLMLAFA